MISKNSKRLNKEFNWCSSKNTFVKVGKESYIDYMDEALSDLNSAAKEENEKWAITKAYQALFLACNALLVRKLGFYSKDHGCVIVALLKHSIVTEEKLARINAMLEQKKKLFSELRPRMNFFDEISNIRITRNKYLYLPRTQRKLKVSAKGVIEEVKEIIRILGEEE